MPCGSEVEALVTEARLIVRHEPPYNRRGKGWRRYAYLKLDTAEAYPRLKVVREPKGGGEYLGPFRSSRLAHLAKEAIEEVFPLRRCTRAMGRTTRFPPCTLAEIGRCVAPCDGRVSRDRYRELALAARSSFARPGGLLEALEARMLDLASHERFEEAALVRDRIRALAEALVRDRMDRWLLGAGRVSVRDADGRVHTLQAGSLDAEVRARPISAPCPRDRADELGAVRSWLSHVRPRLVRAERPLSEPVAGGPALHRLLARMRAADGRPVGAD